MDKVETRHLGRNIKAFRSLRGMKQQVFAEAMGIAQQNVSKMENKAKVSDEQLEQASKVLGTTVEALKNFDARVIVNNNLFSNDQHNHPITEVMAYFKSEIEKKDEEIANLREQLADAKGRRSKPRAKTEPKATLRKVAEA